MLGVFDTDGFASDLVWRSATKLTGRPRKGLLEAVTVPTDLKRARSFTSRRTGKLASALAICTREPETFRANLRAHVDTMGPLGFNAHALGVLASRNLHLFLSTPQALAARFGMLREVFGPAADELAADIRRTGITPACLPAVAHDAAGSCCSRGLGNLVPAQGGARWARRHHAWTQESVEEHLRKLVAAGLFASEAEARHECMRRWNKLLKSRTLEWLLQRRAAVLEAGGTEHDVRAVCGQNASLPVVLRGLLLWQRAKCVHCAPELLNEQLMVKLART